MIGFNVEKQEVKPCIKLTDIYFSHPFAGIKESEDNTSQREQEISVVAGT